MEPEKIVKTNSEVFLKSCRKSMTGSKSLVKTSTRGGVKFIHDSNEEITYLLFHKANIVQPSPSSLLKCSFNKKKSPNIFLHSIDLIICSSKILFMDKYYFSNSFRQRSKKTKMYFYFLSFFSSVALHSKMHAVVSNVFLKI